MTREEKYKELISRLSSRLNQAKKEYAQYKKGISKLKQGTKIMDTHYKLPMIVSDPHYSDMEFSAEFASHRGATKIYNYGDSTWEIIPDKEDLT